MKNVASTVGTFTTSTVGVYGMQNFNPFTMAFWATLTGILLFSILSGLITGLAFEGIKTQLKKWHGTGQKHSKGL